MAIRYLLLTCALGCVLLTGCRSHPWRRPAAPYCPPPASGRLTIPPVGIPEGPPPPAPVPGGTIREFGNPPPPVPGGHGSELLLPQGGSPGRNRSEYPRAVTPQQYGAILGQPDYVERPRVVEADPPRDEPNAPETKKPADAASTGISEFTQVKAGVSTGGRPELDGLDWLKAKGYQSVVYLRRPGDDDTTDRRQVERRQMKYVSLVVSPETLTQDWLDEFNRVVGDSSARPIFVYARDPEMAGAAWYLHLRTAEFLTHDEARVRAARLGLRDERSEMFQAAMKLLPPNS